MTRIYGAGGGGGGGGGGSQQTSYTPSIAPDSLDSKQYATVLDLISEGEIQGLKDGLRSIFLNNTPIQNTNGSLNFQGVTVDTRNGTQAQSYIPIAADVEDEKPVGVEVQYGTPVTRQIADSNVNAVRVTITVPQLQAQGDKGDVGGADFSLSIAVQYNGGGFQTVISDNISGRTTDPYQRDYLINLAPGFTTAGLRRETGFSAIGASVVLDREPVLPYTCRYAEYFNLFLISFPQNFTGLYGFEFY